FLAADREQIELERSPTIVEVEIPGPARPYRRPGAGGLAAAAAAGEVAHAQDPVVGAGIGRRLIGNPVARTRRALGRNEERESDARPEIVPPLHALHFSRIDHRGLHLRL